MEFNVTLSLVGLNMSAIEQGGDGGDGGDDESDGMALAYATLNYTRIAFDWFDFLGEGPEPDPMHPGAVLLRLRFRIPRFGQESQDSMKQKYNGYRSYYENVPLYNRELDVFAKQLNAPLVSKVNISAVFVGEVRFVGNFMPIAVPSMSPVMVGPAFIGLEFNATLIVSGLDFQKIKDLPEEQSVREKMAIVMATQNLTGILTGMMDVDVSVYGPDSSNPSIPLMKVIINVKDPR
jgi:hypothetical protein